MWLPLVFFPTVFQAVLFKQQDVDQSMCVSKKWRADGQRGVEWVGDNRVWQVNYSWRPWHEIAAKKKIRQRDNTLRWESDEKVAGMRAFEWKVKGQRKKAIKRKGKTGRKDRTRGWEENVISFTRVEIFSLKKKKHEKRRRLFSSCTKSTERRGGWDGTIEEGIKGQSQKVSRSCVQHREAFRALMH